jgi:hypothetical protein
VLIPDDVPMSHDVGIKGGFRATAWGWACVLSGSWWGNGPPSLRRVAGLRGWSATRGLRHGPDSYGRQQ